MKRQLFIFIVATVLTAVSCQDKVLEVPKIEDPTIPGFIKEMRVERQGDPEREIIKIVYDDAGRVSDFYISYYGEEHYTITYGSNKVTIKPYSGSSYELETNSDGFVIKSNKPRVFSYSGRNLTSDKYHLDVLIEDDVVVAEADIETSFTWENGNLTKKTYTLKSTNEEAYPSESSIRSFTYNTVLSPFFQKGIDPFLVIAGETHFMNGLFGDSNKYMMSSYDGNIITVSNVAGKPGITHIRVTGKSGVIADCELIY